MKTPKLSDAVPPIPPIDPTPAASTLMLSRKDLARELRVSVATVDRLHAGGRLPAAIRLAGSLRWLRAAIVEWAQNGCPPRS